MGTPSSQYLGAIKSQTVQEGEPSSQPQSRRERKVGPWAPRTPVPASSLGHLLQKKMIKIPGLKQILQFSMYNTNIQSISAQYTASKAQISREQMNYSANVAALSVHAQNIK
ncbi:unnamed protein product [Rangifer tarandus platyrhynchus]|uniref:Uncharacterized protein n=1 Tax=Rangifer tarandus platyrhynchus TaxID=3082113 RepID=A0AC59Z761_RANTA